MNKNFVAIYALAICFFTVACFVIVAGMTAWDTVQLAAPEFTINSNKYDAHLSDQQYLDWLIQRNQYRDEEFIPPGSAELTKARHTRWKQALKSEQRSALQSLTQNLIILVVNILVFMIHWVIARKSREVHS